jgi:hypothetical protein
MKITRSKNCLGAQVMVMTVMGSRLSWFLNKNKEFAIQITNCLGTTKHNHTADFEALNLLMDSFEKSPLTTFSCFKQILGIEPY